MQSGRGRLTYHGLMRWSSQRCRQQGARLRLMLLSCIGSLQLVMSHPVPPSEFQAGRMLNFGGPQVRSHSHQTLHSSQGALVQMKLPMMHLLLQDVTGNPASLSGPFLDGACGYGQLSPSQWPFYALASISSNNSIATEASCSGCGACVEIQCVGQVKNVQSAGAACLLAFT